jgi:hypothetical protein
VADSIKGQPAVQQKARLAGVAQHVQAGVLTGQRHPGEVDVRGDVFQPDIGQRVGVSLVRAVAHHRAHVPLRMVVLTLRETIVQKESGATPAAALQAGPEAVGQCGNESLGLGVDFAQVVLRAFDLDRRPQFGGAVGPGQGIALQRHATLPPDAAGLPTLAHQQLDRHGIQHLVAHHHALNRLGQRVHPTHGVAKAGQSRLLARTQRARQVHDGVAAHRSPRVSSSCCASAPEPAPNSQTSSVPVAASASPTCAASAWPNSGLSSGAVTKSLPSPFTPSGMVPNLAPLLA